MAFHCALILSALLCERLRQDRVRGHQANAIICFKHIESAECMYTLLLLLCACVCVYASVMAGACSQGK